MADEETKVDRRGMLLGTLGGVVVGGGAGFFAGTQEQKAKDLDAMPSAAPPKPSGSALRPPPPKVLGFPPSGIYPLPSYAQQGEDLVMREMLQDQMNVSMPTYIDIGAFDPIESNNTFLFFLIGCRGVLVEPNPALTARLREKRPGDKVLEVGIGVNDATEADYYTFEDARGQLNTFSKEQAERLRKKGARGEKVLKRRLVKINDVLAEHFKDRAPDLFSIDIEGLDLEIMKTMDFDRWRPRVICTETASDEGGVEKDTLEFLIAKGYEVRGGSFVNTIFRDTKPPKKP